ncbi:MAG: DUF6597 domain-containing transcriptional factor [Ilumatobacteraceae bacterium]
MTGVITKRFDVPLVGCGWVLGVKFRPGGLAAFGRLDARELTDRVVPAVNLLPVSLCNEMRSIAADTAAGQAADVADTALVRPDPERT